MFDPMGFELDANAAWTPEMFKGVFEVDRNEAIILAHSIFLVSARIHLLQHNQIKPPNKWLPWTWRLRHKHRAICDAWRQRMGVLWAVCDAQIEGWREIPWVNRFFNERTMGR